jgi:hypothetical protein
MKLIAVALLLALGTALDRARAIDLTPHEITLTDDGPPVKRYFFQDGDKRLSFRIDEKMTVRGGSEAAVFGFNDLQTGMVSLSKSKAGSEVPFDQQHFESYRATARTFLPTDATNVLLVEEKLDAIAINGWTSQQFVFTYTSSGVPHRQSITFFNYSEKEQIILNVRASAPDYEKAYLRGYRVLNSLSDLPVSSDSGPT